MCGKSQINSHDESIIISKIITAKFFLEFHLDSYVDFTLAERPNSPAEMERSGIAVRGQRLGNGY